MISEWFHTYQNRPSSVDGVTQIQMGETSIRPTLTSPTFDSVCSSRRCRNTTERFEREL